MCQPLWCLTMALLSTVQSSRTLPMHLTLFTPHHPLTSTSPMDSLRPWWQSSRILTGKLMVPLMLWHELYSSYETHLSQLIFLHQLKFFMDTQHKEPFLVDAPNQSNIWQICQKLIQIQDRRNSLTRLTQLRNYIFSRSRSKWNSSPASQEQLPKVANWYSDPNMGL